MNTDRVLCAECDCNLNCDWDDSWNDDTTLFLLIAHANLNQITRIPLLENSKAP